MRLLDLIRVTRRDRHELHALRTLREQVAGASWKRSGIVAALPLPGLAAELLDFEGVFAPPALPAQPDPIEVIQLTQWLEYLAGLQQGDQAERALAELLDPLTDEIAELPEGDDFGLSISVLERIDAPAEMVDRLVRAVLTGPFRRLAATVKTNVLHASGIDPQRPSSKQTVMPRDAKDQTPVALVERYLRGTPFVGFLRTTVPFSIPHSARFEHTHIVGGSGHGKTQLLQSLLLRDLMHLSHGRGSVVVIDSQGDMIRTVTNLAKLSPRDAGKLSDRLVLIDPNDVENPPALNLFDFGLDRLERYSPVEREKLINGAIALYEYMFGALLGADLTQRQGVIFRYLARLMMVVPVATIHTLREFMEEPEATRQHLSKLDFTSRHFFETQFYSGAFDDTRQQILTRLWGVLSNSVLERMFANPKNKVDLFDAMNRGSIILINTAKDLLKQEGCEILGRFFIAMISHAAQERASIPADRRRATFVYIDEAQDYFDKSVEMLLNQARKYKVGLVLAHQNLGQFEPRLMAAVMASTAIKLAGGVSAKDAAALSKEMRCESEFLQGMRKRSSHTEFAAYVKNVTRQPVQLVVPFGQMEAQPKMSGEEFEELLAQNRSRYASTGEDKTRSGAQVKAASHFPLGDQEIL